MDQLKTTFRALGTPTEEEWPVSHTNNRENQFPNNLHPILIKKLFYTPGPYQTPRLRPSGPIPQATPPGPLHSRIHRSPQSPCPLPNIRPQKTSNSKRRSSPPLLLRPSLPNHAFQTPENCETNRRGCCSCGRCERRQWYPRERRRRG